MFPLMQGKGTIPDQWREAGIDVALGRMTADELYRFGKKLFADVCNKDEFEEMQDALEGAEEDADSEMA